MSIVKIGIMVEVYRYYGGTVDDLTHQELLEMLGSESCNPCANRLLATVGNGSAYTGAERVTNTMRRLGLANFYLCAPFRLETRRDDNSEIVWAANTGLWLAQADETPRYDRCVRATPREMANLVEMIYLGTQDEGLLREMYPSAITPAVCRDMIDIMAANDLRNMLGAGIPAETKLAHKHGFSGYDVPWGDTRGEVGIVYSPGTNWLISFYIWQDTPWINWGINQPLYRDVSNMLYNYFNAEEPYWPLPPWAPPPEEDTGEGET
jgi:beta-lactamase class A